jgi:chromosome partitioning protein
MKIVALAQQKGGVGKSSLAIGLAVVAVAKGKSAAIVELDPQGTVRRWNERRNSPGVKAEPAVFSIEPAQLTSTLATLKADGADWVFLDLPGRNAPAVNAGIRVADLVLIPARPLDVDLEASDETVAAAQRLARPYAFVMNITPTRGARAEQWAEGLRKAGHAVAEPIIVERIQVPDAIAEGQGVTEYDPKGKAADELAELWVWINKRTSKS